jgi:hypothetical protein
VAIILAYAQRNYAQVTRKAQSSSASHVAAEMTKGKLNPLESKPGDAVVVKLMDDLKSNGQVVLKKGTTITGIVRTVKRAEGHGAAKAESKTALQSMMQIEWLAPAPQGKAVQNLSIALQSVTQVNPIHKHEHESADDFGLPGRADFGSGTVATGPSNAALLSMPSVVAVDHETGSAISSGLGASSSQLFKVGRGQLVTAAGSQQSVDIFSHLNNDTVITSSNSNFEISSGARMQLLVGVNKK